MAGYRKRVRHFHEPGDLHELTFSCDQRMPILTNDVWRTLPCQHQKEKVRHSHELLDWHLKCPSVFATDPVRGAIPDSGCLGIQSMFFRRSPERIKGSRPVNPTSLPRKVPPCRIAIRCNESQIRTSNSKKGGTWLFIREHHAFCREGFRRLFRSRRLGPPARLEVPTLGPVPKMLGGLLADK